MANMPGGGPGGGSGGPVFRSLRSRRRSSGPPFRLIGALVLLAVLGAGAWYWYRSRTPTEDPMEAVSPEPVDSTTDLSGVGPDVPPLDLPELEESDELIREHVGGLSPHPLLARWLIPDALVRRFVTTVVNIAAGGSPAEHMESMAPEGSFEVTPSDGGLQIDLDSWARYDPVVDAFTSLATERAAQLYLQLHPLFEEAYAELGIADRTFDETLAVAMGNLLAVDVPDPPLEVEPDEAIYVYTDPALEALTPAEKHLLRMGPENARRVQDKLQSLAVVLGIEPTGGGGEG